MKRRRGKNVSDSPVWPLIWSDSSFVLNHLRVHSQPVLPTPLFSQAPGIIESVWSWECHGALISPLAFIFSSPPFLSLCAHLFFPPISSSFQHFLSCVSLNLCHPPIPHRKGSFCKRLMERLLSNKDRPWCGTATTNRIFCSRSEESLSSRGV